MWTPWHALWTGLMATACLACTGDNAECIPFKAVECGSNVYDISFILDRSKSMVWDMTTSRNGRVCAVDITTKSNCRRQDIMRFVLRQVLLKAFKKFQQPCLEYEQSDQFIETKINCFGRGFTFPRFHNIWWWNTGTFTRKGENFRGPNGLADRNQLSWNTEFTNYFYVNNNGAWVPRDNRWTGVGTRNPQMVESAVKTFFERELLKVEGNNGYPTGDGGTTLYRGFDASQKVLNEVYAEYSTKQKAAAKFPIFVMTDGELSSVRDYPRNSITNLKSQLKSLSATVGGKTEYYGLGLTGRGNNRLQNEQTKLYDNLDFTFKNDQNEKFFFDDAVTANRIVDEILGNIEENCEECYTWATIPPTKLCVPIGAKAPTLPGSTNEPPPELQDPPVIKVDSPTTFIYDTLKSSIYVQYGERTKKVVRQIAAGTNLCSEKYDGTDLEFIPYGVNGNCRCCQGVDDCLCDFRHVSFSTDKATIGGVEGVETIVYDEGDPFISNFMSQPESNFPLIVSAPPVVPPPVDNEDDDKNDGDQDDTSIGDVGKIDDEENPGLSPPKVVEEEETEVRSQNLNSAASLVPSAITMLALGASCSI